MRNNDGHDENRDNKQLNEELKGQNDNEERKDVNNHLKLKTQVSSPKALN